MIAIKHITRYGPYSETDRGYACAWALIDDRTFNFHCDLDGRRVRAIYTLQKNYRWVKVQYSKEKMWADRIEPAAVEAFKTEVS